VDFWRYIICERPLYLMSTFNKASCERQRSHLVANNVYGIFRARCVVALCSTVYTVIARLIYCGDVW
jgi:hypothetical protein